jgi:hypothetical protein
MNYASIYSQNRKRKPRKSIHPKRRKSKVNYPRKSGKTEASVKRGGARLETHRQARARRNREAGNVLKSQPSPEYRSARPGEIAGRWVDFLTGEVGNFVVSEDGKSLLKVVTCSGLQLIA